MFYTYAAHPAACAVADRVLDTLGRERLVERAAVMGDALARRLATLRDHPHVADTRGLGLLQAVELVKDRATRTQYPSEYNVVGGVIATGLANGVFFYPGGGHPAPDVVCLGPPFTITEDELDLAVEALRRAIDAATS